MASNKNNAKITDVDTILAAGINPKTGLPYKMGSDDCALADNISRNLQLLDRQNALNRYVWTGLPTGLTADLIERILYYKGQGMLFYMESNDAFYFLPYALDGTIDCYGRFQQVTPIPFGGGATRDNDGKEKPWIQGLTRKPVYELSEVLSEITPQDYTTKCILLHDYSHGISQTNIPRVELQRPIIDTMAKCIPYMRTALMNATGVQGVRVSNESDYQNVALASSAIENAALSGKKYIPVIGGLDFQDLTSGNVGKSEEFMLALQSLDNFRLGQYGICNGGVFAKKAHMLQTEQETNQGNTGLIYNDGLALRQEFCLLARFLFGLEMWCEASETIVGIDKNLDGEISDEKDGQMNIDHPDTGGISNDSE